MNANDKVTASPPSNEMPISTSGNRRSGRYLKIPRVGIASMPFASERSRSAGRPSRSLSSTRTSASPQLQRQTERAFKDSSPRWVWAGQVW